MKWLIFLLNVKVTILKNQKTHFLSILIYYRKIKLHSDVVGNGTYQLW